nr:hypothetical protein [Tanacetum cinerariifolium]
DFNTRFVPQIESYAEQAFWSQYLVQTDEPTHSGTTIVEVLKELPKVSMELFTSFDQYLIDDVSEVQKIFKQMEMAVEQHCVEKTKMENVLKENDRLLTHALGVKIVNIVVNDCMNRDTMSSSESAPTFAELFETNDLKAQIQEKDTVDVVPLVPKLRKNRTAHIDYIKNTIEEAATLRELVDERLLSPLNTPLAYACKYTRRIQELLMILQQTCPRITDLGTNLVAVTPKNQNKQVRRTPQITKSKKTSVDTSPSPNIDSNIPVHSSTGVALVSSASRSQSKDNTKKNRIQRTFKKAKETELEDHPRKVKSSLNKASVVDSRAKSSVIKSVSNVNSNFKYASCNGCLFSDNHDACVVEYINSMNASRKSKSAKKPVKRKVWKTTGKVFKTVGYKWKPTGRTFTKPRAKNVPNKMEPNKSWGSSYNVSTSITDCRLSKSSFGTVKFGNDHVAKIMGYGDYQIGNVTISQVYYVEGLGHNLFSVGQFCDSDLEVAFRQHTCFIRNLEGVDLLTGSWGNNLYTLSLQDMMASSPICLLSMASKTKSWLWHR